MKQLYPYLLSPLAACAVFAAAPASSQPIQNYRASGNEPSWGLTINPQNINFTRLNGRAIAVVTPRSNRNPTGRSYRTPRLYVTIRNARCIDSMSGKTFPDRVTVLADGRRYTGCGNAVAPPQGNLSNTNWHVRTINGAIPRGNIGAFLNFNNNNTWNGSFGCFRLNGGFRQNGRNLNANHEVSGRRCNDSIANTIEDTSRQIMNQPMMVDWTNNRRVQLHNRLGRIDLERSN